MKAAFFHIINPAMYLGNPPPSPIDGEPDGQPDANAMGDDNDGNDDEGGVGGVGWYPMIDGKLSAIDVTASMPGVIDLWIDFNANGSWLDPNEKVTLTPGPNVGPGTTHLSFMVPAGTPPGTTFARVRYSSTGTPNPTGMAQDGEVEDYEVKILPRDAEVYDYGDAYDDGTAATYPTLNLSGGAAHVLGAGPHLGNVPPDGEPDGQPDIPALGDDNFDGNDDEDGVDCRTLTPRSSPPEIRTC